MTEDTSVKEQVRSLVFANLPRSIIGSLLAVLLLLAIAILIATTVSGKQFVVGPVNIGWSKDQSVLISSHLLVKGQELKFPTYDAAGHRYIQRYHVTFPPGNFTHTPVVRASLYQLVIDPPQKTVGVIAAVDPNSITTDGCDIELSRWEDCEITQLGVMWIAAPAP